MADDNKDDNWFLEEQYTAGDAAHEFFAKDENEEE